MWDKKLLSVYLKPVFTQERMADGELQGFAMMAGAPMDAVIRLLDVGLLAELHDQRIDLLSQFLTGQELSQLVPDVVEMQSEAGAAGTLVNPADTLGNFDGIRLLAAYRQSDSKATPIVPRPAWVPITGRRLSPRR